MTEKKAITFFAILAFWHVVVFSALVPFYQITDEQCHLDLAIHYSHYWLPVKYEPFSAESSYYCALYNSMDLVSHPGMDFPPGTNSFQFAQQDEPVWMHWTNHEYAQPPLYYFYAGRIWALCKWTGLKNVWLPYAMRGSNALLLVATVLLAWRYAALVFPENLFVRLAAPGIIACMPQSIYYCISNDNIVALTCGLAIYVLCRCWLAPVLTGRLGCSMGLAMAGMVLAKLTTIPVLGVLLLCLFWKVFLLYRSGQLRTSLAGLSVTLIAFVLPTMGWFAWCKLHFQSWTGNAAKMAELGWTQKPFAEWFHHPIFTVHGLAFFVYHNIATFWQGEARWHLELLRNPWADLFYMALTIAVVCTIAIKLVKPANPFAVLPRLDLLCAFGGLLAMFIFLGWLSIQFDFHGCWYPSQAQPFFTSGRLMLGILIPFTTVVAFSFETWMYQFHPRYQYAVLGLFLAGMLGMEVWVDSPLYASWYNLIHLAGSPIG